MFGLARDGRSSPRDACLSRDGLAPCIANRPEDFETSSPKDALGDPLLVELVPAAVPARHLRGQVPSNWCSQTAHAHVWDNDGDRRVTGEGGAAVAGLRSQHTESDCCSAAG